MDDLISFLLDESHQSSLCQNDMHDMNLSGASEVVAESLLIHDLLIGIGSRGDAAEAERIHTVMEGIDAEVAADSVNVALAECGVRSAYVCGFDPGIDD